MKTVYRIMALAALCIVTAISYSSTATAQTGLGIDQSSSGGQILNPYPGEQIMDKQPMIGVKLPEVLQTLTTASSTVKIYFYMDGSEVSGEAQVSVDYIFYVPAIPLKLGTHNIRVSYKLFDLTNGQETDITGLPPISWSFSVVAKLDRPAAPVYNPNEKPSTTGRVYLNLANVALDKATRVTTGWLDDSDIKYQEAPAVLTGTYDFTHRFYGKSLTGHYERYYEELTERPNDYFFFRYIDFNDDVYLGDFPVTFMNFSELTINGIRLRGIMSIKPLNPKYKLTTLAGRSMEPQQGYFKRKTLAAKVDTTLSKNDQFRVTVLESVEHGTINTTTAVPKRDQILGVKNMFRYNKRMTLDSMTAFSNHDETGVTGKTVMNKDFAYKNFITYRTRRVEALAGRRTIGPSYNPTTIGTYTEADREGTYGSFKYRSSPRFNAETFYDAYHNNVRHTATYDYTDRSTNSITSLMFNYPHLPRVTARYSKLYTNTDPKTLSKGTNYSETTSASLMMFKVFNDFFIFNNPTFITNFIRSDSDSITYPTTATTFNLSSVRSDLRSYTFTAMYKSFAQLNFTTMRNNSLASTTSALSDTRSNSDSLGLQLNIIPFKFITNLNYRRQASLTRQLPYGTNTSEYVTGAPEETQHVLTFIYYLTQKKKVSLDLENYDKEYRSPLYSGKSYIERVVRLGYTLDF